MAKVDELVEWVALMLSGQYGRSREYQTPFARALVQEMAEKFDLALIDRKESIFVDGDMDEYIPLAKALKNELQEKIRRLE